MSWPRHRALLAVAGAVVTAFVLAGAHLVWVHASFGVWQWSPQLPTPLLPWAGREYRLRAPQLLSAAGLIRVGITGGGEVLLGPGGPVPARLVLALPAGGYALYTLEAAS